MKIGIVSLGLIGGSIFKNLCENGFEVYAVTRNLKTVEEALKYSKNVSSDYNILKDCDVVFVSSPVGETLKILDLLENTVKKDCIVLDCASVKEFVMKKKRPYKFIGSHPMAGTENSGFNASFKELFSGAKWVLIPSEGINETDIKTVSEIIRKTGAEIIITDAKEHDRAVALISHMPLLLSQALFHCASGNKLAMLLASSGFRDMTRLALSNLKMAEDMRSFNGENIEFSLQKLNESINFLKNTKVPEIFADIKNMRSKMYSAQGTNIVKGEKENLPD